MFDKQITITQTRKLEFKCNYELVFLQMIIKDFGKVKGLVQSKISFTANSLIKYCSSKKVNKKYLVSEGKV